MNRSRFIKPLIIYASCIVAVILYKISGRFIRSVIGNSFIQDLAAQICLSIYALILVFIFRRQDMFRAPGSQLFRKGWSSAGFEFFLIIWAFFFGASALFEVTATQGEILCFVLQMILVGFCEEVMFRGLIQSSVHEAVGEDSFLHVLLAVFIGGLLFGSAHLMNATSSEVSFRSAAFQALVTAFSGMYYGAIYFRTGKNLWYVAILHALYDGVAFIGSGRLGGTVGTAIIDQSGNVGVYGGIFWSVIYLIATVFVLRPKRIAHLLSSASLNMEFQEENPQKN